VVIDERVGELRRNIKVCLWFVSRPTVPLDSSIPQQRSR
jgi:hypothetical protein